MVDTSISPAPCDGGVAALESMANYAAPVGRHYNHATREQLSRRFRDQRWAQRTVNRHLLPGTACAGCGRPVSKQTGIGLYYDDKHRARYSGLRTCGSVWCCPVCNAKIQNVRQSEIQQALKVAKERGYGVVFGTLTLRHTLDDELQSVRAMIQKVWRSVMQQHGTRSMLDGLGRLGYIRAMESTYSPANGWHVHFHVFWFFRHPLDKDRVAAFQADFADRWIKSVERVNKKHPESAPFAAPLAEHQLFKALRLSDNVIDTYSRYCTTRKSVALPGRNAIWRAAHEITDSQSKPGKVKMHNGKPVLHTNYWDWLSILSELGYGTKSFDAHCNPRNTRYVRLVKFGYTPKRIVALAKEYYRAMKGSRALVWSRHLRDILGIAPEEDDATIAAQDFADPKSHVLTVWDWSACLSRREHLAVGLLDVCDKYYGSPRVCLDWCKTHGIHTKPPHLRNPARHDDFYV